MRVVYTGPLLEVEVSDALTGTSAHARRGEPIEVDEDLGARLCEQACWEPAPAEPAPKGKKE